MIATEDIEQKVGQFKPNATRKDMPWMRFPHAPVAQRCLAKSPFISFGCTSAGFGWPSEAFGWPSEGFVRPSATCKRRFYKAENIKVKVCKNKINLLPESLHHAAQAIAACCVDNHSALRMEPQRTA